MRHRNLKRNSDYEAIRWTNDLIKKIDAPIVGSCKLPLVDKDYA